MAFEQVTVTGTYVRADGEAAAGTVEFVLSSALQDAATDEIRPPVPMTATLDEAGAISISLVSTLTEGIEPQGATYRVTERIVGAPARTYNIAV